MAISDVGGAVAADFTSGTALATGALSAAVQVGDLIIASMYYAPDSTSDTACSCADSLGNAYTEVTNHGFDTGENLRHFWCYSAFAGTPNVTLTPAAASSFRTSHAHALRGVSGTRLGDIFAAPASPGTGTDAISSGNINITTQPALSWGFCVDRGANATPLIGTGYTAESHTTIRVQAEWQEVSATGNKAATFTSGVGAGADQYFVSEIAFVRDSTGGPSTGPVTLTSQRNRRSVGRYF